MDTAYNRPAHHATPRDKAGFTLVELLVTLTIIGMLIAILFPVFARAHDSAQRTTCLSNERQLGMAFLQYATDNDGYFPSNQTPDIHGIWARQVYPYAKNTSIYRCPGDDTKDGEWKEKEEDSGDVYSVASYAMNLNLTANGVYQLVTSGKPMPPVSDSRLVAPARTVLAFEVAGAAAALGNLPANRHVACAPTGNGARDPLNPNSPFVNGCRPADNKVYFGVQYATGTLGKRRTNEDEMILFTSIRPRHTERANYLACDGHVISLTGSSVSGGESQPTGGAHCHEDESIKPCGGKNTAAGTADSTARLTFSTE